MTTGLTSSNESGFTDSDINQITMLASTNVDSAELFKTAADETSDRRLKNFFLECSRIRTGFANDFRRLLELSNNEPPPDGTIGRVLHQWWIEIRELLTHTERHAIVNEMLKEEESIKAMYEDAFAAVGSQRIRDVIEGHYQHIKKIHESIKALHERTKDDIT